MSDIRRFPRPRYGNTLRHEGAIPITYYEDYYITPEGTIQDHLFKIVKPWGDSLQCITLVKNNELHTINLFKLLCFMFLPEIYFPNSKKVFPPVDRRKIPKKKPMRYKKSRGRRY